MGSINGKFTDQNSLILQAQLTVARTNVKTDLSTIIIENDAIRSTNTFLNSQLSTNGSAANQAPSVALTAQQSVGVAQSTGEISDSGQPCHIPITTITLDTGHTFIHNIRINDTVLSFDAKTGERFSDIVTATFQHRVDEWLKVIFADGHSSGVDKEGAHKYWTQDGQYQPISELNYVWRWVEGIWMRRPIVEKVVIKERTILYNFTTERYHNYEANGNACSNAKRDPQLNDGENLES